MASIKINNIDLEFKDGAIYYQTLNKLKIITFEKDDEKSFSNALMQVINLIEYSNSKKSL